MRSDPAPARVQRAPATRDQVDAYRFGLRRMEAALVRGDPVPLHEQLRSQRRAVFAGVLLGLLALGVTAMLARTSPATDWRAQALVRGERSGVVYAVVADPPVLVPVADAVAGRLVLAVHGRSDGAGAVPAPVPDADLATAPRLPQAAVPGAVGVALDGAPVPPAWAVCDTEPGTTTVLAGSLGPVPPGQGPAALLTAEGGATYLVHGGTRHRADLADRHVLSGLGLLGAPVRRVGAGLLSAIPEGEPLRLPDAGPGDVVVNQPLGAPLAYYLAVGDGFGRIPVTLADALLSRSGAGPRTLSEGMLAEAPSEAVPGADAWPTERPDSSGIGPVLCRTWQDGRGGLVVADRLPVASGAVPVRLAGADGPGPRLDEVVLPASGAGPLRAAVPGGAGGTRWLLAASGSVHGIADDATAAALGVGAAGEAPPEIVRLLPRGGVLDVKAARELVDVPG